MEARKFVETGIFLEWYSKYEADAEIARLKRQLRTSTKMLTMLSMSCKLVKKF